MAYFLYPELQSQLDITLATLSENRIRYRVDKEYKHDPLNPFVVQIKNFVVEIFCDYEKFCFIKYLIGKKLDDIVHLEKSLQQEIKTQPTVEIPEFMKEEVKNGY